MKPLVVLLLAAATADDDVLLRQLNSSFRPFKANNTEAYAYADWVGSQIAPRDAMMLDAACRERVVAAAKGIEWNSVGCSFPASWRYDAAALRDPRVSGALYESWDVAPDPSAYT